MARRDTERRNGLDLEAAPTEPRRVRDATIEWKRPASSVIEETDQTRVQRSWFMIMCTIMCAAPCARHMRNGEHVPHADRKKCKIPNRMYDNRNTT